MDKRKYVAFDVHLATITFCVVDPVGTMRIPVRSASNSSNIRPPIPVEFGHLFRRDPAGCSGAIRPAIPGHSAIPYGER